jgi:hypothetical protein
MNNGVCERLPVDSKFARRLMRGTSSDRNAHVTAQQSEVLKTYVPAAKWTKGERVVYIIMQDFLDKTGSAPTAKQISDISLARQDLNEEGACSGLSLSEVKRTLRKLQKRGIVFEV